MKATKTAASSTALILWKYTCTCEHKKLTKFPMSISVSAHSGFGVVVRWEERDNRDRGVNGMIGADGLALFLSSLPL